MSTMNMKQDDHPAHDMPDATEQYAGDVLPIDGDRSMGSGPDSRAVDYALGKKTDPKVTPMPIGKTKEWNDRVRAR